MLKGINPLLNAEVLQVLRAMGHGDDLIIADTNFPSESADGTESTGYRDWSGYIVEAVLLSAATCQPDR